MAMTDRSRSRRGKRPQEIKRPATKAREIRPAEQGPQTKPQIKSSDTGKERSGEAMHMRKARAGPRTEDSHKHPAGNASSRARTEKGGER